MFVCMYVSTCLSVYVNMYVYVYLCICICVCAFKDEGTKAPEDQELACGSAVCGV